MTRTPTLVLCAGSICSMRRAIASISALAAASDVFGASRPTTLIHRSPRALWSRSRAEKRVVIQTSTGSGHVIDAGAMPTTTVGKSSNSSARPTTFGSPPNRRRHRPSLSIATRGAETLSSPTAKPRPSSGSHRQHGHGVCRDARLRKTLWFAAPGENRLARRRRRETGKRCCRGAPVDEIARRHDAEHVGIGVPAVKDGRHRDEPLGLGIRQRP